MCAGTQEALDASIRWVRSGGTGSPVSMAEAKGCTSSGQRGSQTQSALAQWRQKLRRAGLGFDLPVSLSFILAR